MAIFIQSMVTKQEVEEIIDTKLSEQADSIQQSFNDVQSTIIGLRVDVLEVRQGLSELQDKVVRGFQATDRRMDSLCDQIDNFMKLHGVFASDLKEVNQRMDRFEQAYPLPV